MSPDDVGILLESDKSRFESALEMKLKMLMSSSVNCGPSCLSCKARQRSGLQRDQKGLR